MLLLARRLRRRQRLLTVAAMILMMTATVVVGQQDILGVLKVTECIRDVTEFMPGGVRANTSLLPCVQRQSLQLVNILATPSTQSQSLVSFNLGDANITAAERLAVGSQALLSGRALVKLEMSAVRVRYILDEIGILPHSYTMTPKFDGNTCNFDNKDRADGTDAVLFCPQTIGQLDAGGQSGNGVRAKVGNMDRLTNNELWPRNVGCRQSTVAGPWYLAYIGSNVSESQLFRSSVNPFSAQIDDQTQYNTASPNKQANWILQSPLPTPLNIASPNNRIQCKPNELPNFLIGSPTDYFQTYGTAPSNSTPRYRNVFLVEGNVDRDPQSGNNVCFYYKWRSCSQQSNDDRRAGLPCYDFKFWGDRGYVNCFVPFCVGLWRATGHSVPRGPANAYKTDWTTLQDAQDGNTVTGRQRGNTLAPMCTDGRITGIGGYEWPNNYANTGAYYPLVNRNADPDNDNPDANPAEGRNFDAYGGPGACGRARCNTCWGGLGPMGDMSLSPHEVAMHWRFPIYYRARIRERPFLEFNATATVTTDANVTLVFPVGRISVEGSATERFELSSFFSEDAGNATNSFQVSILGVSALGMPPTQPGDIVGIRDKWRPGGVITLDEAVDFAVRWINEQRGSNAALALPFVDLRQTFDPIGTQQTVTSVMRRPFPDSGWNRYACCQEPGEYSLSRLALLRSIYPEMDLDPSLVLAYAGATVFRSIAKRGARQYGNQGDGFNDGSPLQNPYAQGRCGAAPCPPPDGWFWVNPPEDSVVLGPNCGQQGITNEWYSVGDNTQSYCRSAQVGVCIPGTDRVTIDPTSFPDVMRKRRFDEYQRQVTSGDGAYTEPVPFLPPFLQYNDGRLRVWTCEGALCFEPPDDFALSVWFQFAFTGDFIQLIRDLPTGRLVDLNAPADACNVTIEQEGVLFAAVENTGSVGAEFSVFIQCDGAPFDIFTTSPQTKFIMPAATERFQFVIRGTGAPVESLQQCLLVLRNSIGRTLSQQSVDCLTKVPQGFIDPNGTVSVPPPTPEPFDHGTSVSTGLVIGLAIGGTLFAIIAFELLRRWIRGLRRWAARRRLQRANNRAKVRNIEEVSKQSRQRANRQAQLEQQEVADRRQAAERAEREAADRERALKLAEREATDRERSLELVEQQTKVLAKQEQALEEMVKTMTALSKRVPL